MKSILDLNTQVKESIRVALILTNWKEEVHNLFVWIDNKCVYPMQMIWLIFNV